ncbi:hypothetical protein ACEPAG_69 [Sanghuangporus baumii]
MSVGSATQGNAPQTSSGPPDDGDDESKISLSYMHIGYHPSPIPLMHVPHESMELYSLKPRKWLLYVAANICGITGTLRFFTGSEDLTEQEMEEDVNPGDHYVFCYVGEAHFLDWMLRDIPCSESTTSDRSSAVPEELKDFYGGCPFTRMPPEICDACHLIPVVKGDDYLHRLLASFGEPDDTMGIDDHQNMIMMNKNLRAAFDIMKSVAFLRTPNKFLKTNEVPGRTNDEPDDYRVTIHCLLGNQMVRDALYHGNHSDMTRGAGSVDPPPQGEVVEEYRPKGTLLDVTYAFNVLYCFGHPEAKKKVQEEAEKNYYPDGFVRQGEDRKGREDERKRKRRREGGNDGRHSRQWGTGDNTVAQFDEGEREIDMWDWILIAPYMFRGIRPEDIEAERKRHEREEEEYKVQRFAGWREAIGVSDCEECVADTDLEVHDGDDEKPVSIEEALSRTSPSYSIPPAMT